MSLSCKQQRYIVYGVGALVVAGIGYIKYKRYVSKQQKEADPSPRSDAASAPAPSAPVKESPKEVPSQPSAPARPSKSGVHNELHQKSGVVDGWPGTYWLEQLDKAEVKVDATGNIAGASSLELLTTAATLEEELEALGHELEALVQEKGSKAKNDPEVDGLEEEIVEKKEWLYNNCTRPLALQRALLWRSQH